jgi:hypothetical protein
MRKSKPVRCHKDDLELRRAFQLVKMRVPGIAWWTARFTVRTSTADLFLCDAIPGRNRSIARFTGACMCLASSPNLSRPRRRRRLFFGWPVQANLSPICRIHSNPLPSEQPPPFTAEDEGRRRRRGGLGHDAKQIRMLRIPERITHQEMDPNSH